MTHHTQPLCIFKSFNLFFILLLLYLGYIVTFTKVLTIYLSYFTPSIILLYPLPLNLKNSNKDFHSMKREKPQSIKRGGPVHVRRVRGRSQELGTPTEKRTPLSYNPGQLQHGSAHVKKAGF
jgi:hypothetical protein